MNIILKTVFDSKKLQATFLLFCLLIPASGQTAIYKWVDENGKTHYGSQKPASQNAEKLNIKIKQPEITQDEAIDDKEKPVKKDQKQVDKEEETAPKMSAKEKKRLCVAAKSEVSKIEAKGRIRERDANGNSRYLTDKERDARLAEAKKDVREMCR